MTKSKNKQLIKLLNLSCGNSLSKKNTEKLAKYVAKTHSHNKNCFEIYDAESLMKQICAIENVQYRNEIISIMEALSQIEIRSNTPAILKITAYDIVYILNYANDPEFSGIFLENYLKYGGKKPNLSSLYINLFYIKVFEAIKKKNYGDIMQITKNLSDNMIFNTDIIPYETLIKLNIIGY